MFSFRLLALTVLSLVLLISDCCFGCNLFNGRRARGSLRARSACSAPAQMNAAYTVYVPQAATSIPFQSNDPLPTYYPQLNSYAAYTPTPARSVQQYSPAPYGYFAPTQTNCANGQCGHAW